MEPITSTKQTLRFVSLNVESYAGIDGTNRTLVLSFPPDKPITQFTGDNGVGKTSALRAILTLIGTEEPDNAVNSLTKNKKASLTFEKDGSTYTVALGKNMFSVTETDSVGNRKKLSSPKESLSRLIGNVSLNPMELKNMSGEKQVKWIKDTLGFTKEQTELELDIKRKRKSAYDQRTQVNRSADQIKTELTQDGYFYWSMEHKCLESSDKMLQELEELNSKTLDPKEIQEKLDAASKNNDMLNAAEARLAALADQQKGQVSEIERLRLALAQAEAKLQSIDESIAKGKAYIAENQAARSEYEKVREEASEVKVNAMRRERLDRLTARFADYGRYVDESLALTAKIEETDRLWREFVAAFTPEIEGMEIELGGMLDNQRETGIYFNGHSMSELSESELWQWYVLLLEKTGAKVAVIENITSLGTKAVSAINWFVEQRGGSVFLSAMERNQNSMKVEFYDHID